MIVSDSTRRLTIPLEFTVVCYSCLLKVIPWFIVRAVHLSNVI